MDPMTLAPLIRGVASAGLVEMVMSVWAANAGTARAVIVADTSAALRQLGRAAKAMQMVHRAADLWAFMRFLSNTSFVSCAEQLGSVATSLIRQKPTAESERISMRSLGGNAVYVRRMLYM
jgi:hypothetical protein